MIILGTNSIKDTGFNVANSCRFDSASSADLRISDYSGAGTSRRIRTYSMWIKRSKLAYSVIFGSAGKDHWVFTADHKIQINIGSGTDSRRITDMVFRDVSAFYHIVFAYDTTQGTASNRFTMWVNGAVATTSIVGGKNEVAQNEDALVFINGDTHTIGSDESDYFDGYMAEWVFVDGQKLDADSFGEYDSDSGIWKPKNVSGINLGTNGFYLNFQTASDLGIDAGNDNDFEPTNLTALDQSTDTCTNNFATANPLVVIGNTGQTYADGNLTFNASGNNWTATNSTIGASQGKWYAEFKVVTLASSTGYGNLGITGTENITNGNFASTEANSVGVTLDHRGSGQTYLYSAGSSVQAAGVAFAAGAIVGIAVDMDNNKFYFSQNGTYLTVGGSVGDPTSGSTGTGALTIPAGIETFLFAVGGYSTSFKGTWNFGSPSFAISSGNTDGNGYGNFEYAVPSGYYSLNTKNLSEFG